MTKYNETGQTPKPYDPEDDILLNTPAAAEFIGGKTKPLNPDTLAVWRCIGRYNLPYLKIGRLVRYRQSDLRRFRDQWHQNPK
jgi:hypothetical protein